MLARKIQPSFPANWRVRRAVERTARHTYNRPQWQPERVLLGTQCRWSVAQQQLGEAGQAVESQQQVRVSFPQVFLFHGLVTGCGFSFPDYSNSSSNRRAFCQFRRVWLLLLHTAGQKLTFLPKQPKAKILRYQ